ncbi:neuronal-specific septin-3 isoform X2 [Rhinatrema bivittatum]|uniref:neuronal-specific septin-3 isoform X2 n=1 Tax=Rhinatrema bivittatum TaxID=194408 RepID=UPI00112E8CC9|nr:neuronal-specific septin-3 isoform X2 [Rhinatrema bivittatum]
MEIRPAPSPPGLRRVPTSPKGYPHPKHLPCMSTASAPTAGGGELNPINSSIMKTKLGAGFFKNPASQPLSNSEALAASSQIPVSRVKRVTNSTARCQEERVPGHSRPLTQALSVAPKEESLDPEDPFKLFPAQPSMKKTNSFSLKLRKTNCSFSPARPTTSPSLSPSLTRRCLSFTTSFPSKEEHWSHINKVSSRGMLTSSALKRMPKCSAISKVAVDQPKIQCDGCHDPTMSAPEKDVLAAYHRAPVLQKWVSPQLNVSQAPVHSPQRMSSGAQNTSNPLAVTVAGIEDGKDAKSPKLPTKVKREPDPSPKPVSWRVEEMEGHGSTRVGATVLSAHTNATGLLWRSRKLEDKADGLPGSVDNKSEPAMSDLVPETRPKPAVPMKPIGINSNLLGYIGIDTIIEQMRKKTIKTGFDFNIMVVGQSGLGKSTLVNTLFKSQVSRKSAGWSREDKIPKTVEIKAISHVIEEAGVKMKLTVVDTPGFGDQINNENCWDPIEKYINEQYEKFLKEEVNIARKKRIPDTRVHCCLYFISPTGHSLRPLDLEFMKHLSKVVNIIPVIAKADTMTLEEKIEFKQRVRKELEVNGIEFYPQKEFDEDLEDKTENDKIRESMPFAVVGSDKEFQVNGKRVLGRKTPWGIIEVENLAHCEFALLRDFVIRTHLQDLKEVTHNIHYETYRAKRLNDNGGLPPVSTAEGSEASESNV